MANCRMMRYCRFKNDPVLAIKAQSIINVSYILHQYSTPSGVAKHVANVLWKMYELRILMRAIVPCQLLLLPFSQPAQCAARRKSYPQKSFRLIHLCLIFYF